MNKSIIIFAKSFRNSSFIKKIFKLSLKLRKQIINGWTLKLGFDFFILAVIPAILGLRGIAGITMAFVRWLVIIFIILVILSFSL